jgi:uracil-DNA glycosylase family 4
MESLFKQKLLGLRNPRPAQTFAEAIMGDSSWLKKTPKPIAPTIQKEVFSEKIQVIESLERFAQEKTLEQNSQVLKVPGGEVHVKNVESWQGVGQFSSFDSLKDVLRLDQKLVDIILSKKVPGKVKVLFVSEKFRKMEEVIPEIRGGFIDELLTGFPLKTAEFFERMILAMKLQSEEVIIFPIEGADDTDYSDNVMAIASFYQPEVVVTLGATATSKILKSNDRLSLVHGQFFTRKLGDESSVQIVPLFHPSIIETNQNMKKTAWIDMQKIMKHLKKLP